MSGAPQHAGPPREDTSPHGSSSGLGALERSDSPVLLEDATTIASQEEDEEQARLSDDSLSSAGGALSDISALSDPEDFEVIQPHDSSHESDETSSEASSDASDRVSHNPHRHRRLSSPSSSVLALSFPDPEPFRTAFDMARPIQRHNKTTTNGSSSPEPVSCFASPADSTISEAPTLLSASRTCDKQVQTTRPIDEEEGRLNDADYHISDTVLWEGGSPFQLQQLRSDYHHEPVSESMSSEASAESAEPSLEPRQQEGFTDIATASLRQMIARFATLSRLAGGLGDQFAQINPPVSISSQMQRVKVWAHQVSLRSMAILICLAAAAAAGASYGSFFPQQLFGADYPNHLTAVPDPTVSAATSSSDALGDLLPTTVTGLFGRDTLHREESSTLSDSTSIAISTTRDEEQDQRRPASSVRVKSDSVALSTTKMKTGSVMEYNPLFNSLRAFSAARDATPSELALWTQPAEQARRCLSQAIKPTKLNSTSVPLGATPSPLDEAPVWAWRPAVPTLFKALSTSAGIFRQSVQRLKTSDIHANRKMMRALRRSRSGLSKVERALKQHRHRARQLKVWWWSQHHRFDEAGVWYKHGYQLARKLIRSEKTLQQRAWQLFCDVQNSAQADPPIFRHNRFQHQNVAKDPNKQSTSWTKAVSRRLKPGSSDHSLPQAAPRKVRERLCHGAKKVRQHVLRWMNCHI